MWWLAVPAAGAVLYLLNENLVEQRKKRQLLEQIKLLLEKNRGKRIEPFLEGLLERSGELTAEQLAQALQFGIQEYGDYWLDIVLGIIESIFGTSLEN